MSDKPKIYGFCNAGCRWETVHKDDFEKALTFILQSPYEEGAYILKPVKCYKIYSEIVSGCYYSDIKLIYRDNGVNKSYTFSLTDIDIYRDYFYFEILKITYGLTTLNIVYEVNGNRYIENITGLTNVDISEATLQITRVSNVYMFNADASITLDYVKVTDYTNVIVSSWMSDSEYADLGYIYKASIIIDDVKASSCPTVMFGMTEAASGDYAPYCESFDGGIYIWSKTNTTITIPKIEVIG